MKLDWLGRVYLQRLIDDLVVDFLAECENREIKTVVGHINLATMEASHPSLRDTDSTAFGEYLKRRYHG